MLIMNKTQELIDWFTEQRTRKHLIVAARLEQIQISDNEIISCDFGDASLMLDGSTAVSLRNVRTRGMEKQEVYSDFDTPCDKCGQPYNVFRARVMSENHKSLIVCEKCYNESILKRF